MSQTEGDFWRNSVKPQFDKFHIHYKRIESSVTPGFPDTIVIVHGAVSLIEIKSKPRFLPLLGCTALQKHTMESWIKNGGHAYVLAQVQDNVYFLRGDRIPTNPTENGFDSLASGSRRNFPWTQLHRFLENPA